MADNRQSLSDIKDIAGDAAEANAEAGTTDVPAQPTMPLREQILDQYGRAYATGRRKDAIARVWLKPGTGQIVVNGRDQSTYFARPSLRLVINQPFDVTERRGQYDVMVTVKGGGLSGQAGAVKHGISQALTRYEPVLRAVVRAENPQKELTDIDAEKEVYKQAGCSSTYDTKSGATKQASDIHKLIVSLQKQAQALSAELEDYRQRKRDGTVRDEDDVPSVEELHAEWMADWNKRRNGVDYTP